eukprot:Sdes_comp21019_c0_seq1m19732
MGWDHISNECSLLNSCFLDFLYNFRAKMGFPVCDENLLQELKNCDFQETKNFWKIGLILTRLRFQVQLFKRRTALTKEDGSNHFIGTDISNFVFHHIGKKICRRFAYHLISAAEIMDNLSQAKQSYQWDKLPANERQCREMKSLTAKQQILVWDAVLKSKSKITNKLVRATIKSLLDNKKLSNPSPPRRELLLPCESRFSIKRKNEDSHSNSIQDGFHPSESDGKSLHPPLESNPSSQPEIHPHLSPSCDQDFCSPRSEIHSVCSTDWDTDGVNIEDQRVPATFSSFSSFSSSSAFSSASYSSPSLYKKLKQNPDSTKSLSEIPGSDFSIDSLMKQHPLSPAAPKSLMVHFHPVKYNPKQTGFSVVAMHRPPGKYFNSPQFKIGEFQNSFLYSNQHTIPIYFSSPRFGAGVNFHTLPVGN